MTDRRAFIVNNDAQQVVAADSHDAPLYSARYARYITRMRHLLAAELRRSALYTESKWYSKKARDLRILK